MRALAVSLAFLTLGAVLTVRDAAVRAEASCSERWDAAAIVDVSPKHLVGDEVGRLSPYRTVQMDGRAYDVVPYINKSMGWASVPANPLAKQSVYVTVGITADDRASLDRLAPLCIRATYDGEQWQPKARLWSLGVRADGKAYATVGAGAGPSWPGRVTAHVQILVALPHGRVILDAGELLIGLSD